MDKNIVKANRMLLDIACESLKKNRFNAEVFDDRELLKKHIIKTIGSGKNVGLGGSMSIRELDIFSEISKNNTVYTHTPDMNLEERRKVWLKSIDCDFYLASPQAVTLDGKLIFIDGSGNRCAAITWGPRHLILVAGINKIVKDQEEGLWRARNIAAIRNNIRLEKNNPCVKKGQCVDCSSDDRICNIVTILWKKPKIANISVFLLNEYLGY